MKGGSNLNKDELLENIKNTIGPFKFNTIKNLLKADIILTGAKVGTLVTPTINILGFIVPQYAITLLFIGAGATVLFKPSKKPQEKPKGSMPSTYRSRF